MVWLNNTRQAASPKTTGRRLTSLRAFAKWAGLRDFLSDYIAPTPSKSIPHPLHEGQDGVDRMIRKARNNEERALVVLCGKIGCRIGEALTVRPEDFDLIDMTVTIRGKGDKTRVVPVSTKAWSGLSSWYVARAHLPNQPLITLQDRTARSAVTRMGKLAGLRRRVASHDLRATFAQSVLDFTEDLRVAQELLGHANVTTTEVYTLANQKKMKEAVEF